MQCSPPCSRRFSIPGSHLLLWLALAAGGDAPAHAAPGDCTTECFVDAVNGDDSANHGTSPADAFRSLQKGVDTVEPNGTVRVAPGLYDPNFTEVEKSVTLLGAQAGVDPLTRDATDPITESIVQSNTGFFITGIEAEVVVDGFTFIEKTVGSSIAVSTGLIVNGSEVENVGADVSVRNNVFAGLNIAVASSLGRNPSSLSVVANFFDGTGVGVQAQGDRATDATFTADSNTFVETSGPGVSLLVWTGATITNNTWETQTGLVDPIFVGGCAGCTIAGNSLTAVGGFEAISLFGSQGASTDCTIENNTITDPTNAANYGIFIGQATGTIIRGNRITGAREAGIATDPGSAILDNTITSVGGANTTGIYLRRASTGSTVTGNVVSGANVGIDIDPTAGSASTLIQRNSITGNTTGLTNRATTTANATCNWWGDASGPSGQGAGGGDPVSANVTFSPWLLGDDLENAACGVPPTPTPTQSPTPTPTQAPTATPTPAGVELCGNCIDDDDDGAVDRDDPDCPPRADGMGSGVTDPGRARALAKCQKKLGKTGSSFAAKRQKALLGCIAAVQKCLQVKPSAPACLAGASSKCAKAAGLVVRLEAKLASDLEKSCDDVGAADLTQADGLGFGAEAAACAAVGVPALDSIASIGLCLGRRQACESDRLLRIAAPRAVELLALAGLGPDLYACAIPGDDAGGQGLGDPTRGKALTKCEKAIEKSAAIFVRKELIGLAGCVDAVTKCVQQKPTDAKCLPKARSKCAKSAAKLAGSKGPAAKAVAAIEKACTGGLADLLAPAGLGHGAVAGDCEALGVPALAAPADVAACLVRDHRCRVANLLEASVPRALELLSIGGVAP